MSFDVAATTRIVPDGESLVALHRLFVRFEANLSRSDASFEQRRGGRPPRGP